MTTPREGHSTAPAVATTYPGVAPDDLRSLAPASSQSASAAPATTPVETPRWFETEPDLSILAASASRITIPLSTYTLLAPTPAQRPARSVSPLKRLAHALLGVLIGAPVALALAIVVWAGATGAIAITHIVRLVLSGDIAPAGQADLQLNVSSRLGFLALGDIALTFSLLTLFVGLSTRRRGRLFAIPGFLLTATSLTMLLAGVYLAWPALALLGVPVWARITLLSALPLDALAVGWLPRRRASRRSDRLGATPAPGSTLDEPVLTLIDPVAPLP